MKRYSDIEVEKLIKESVHEMVDSVTPSPLEESWARFEKILKEQQSLSKKAQGQKRKKYFLPLKLVATAGIIIIVAGVFSFSYPGKAKALGGKFVNSVIALLSGTQANIKTDYRHDEQEKAPPLNEGFREVTIGQEIVVSLEQARSISPFPIVIPRYSPAGYQLDTVKLQEMVKPVVKVTLNFIGPGLNSFFITQINSPSDYAQGYGYDIDDATVQDFEAGENNGKMITFKNNKVKSMWMKQGVVYILEGSIQKEEISKIIESM